MKACHKIVVLLSVILVFPGIISAYEQHEPILIEDIHATADDPYIIEGYEISSDSSNCIEVKNSEHVIIRNNYLHHCNWSVKSDPLSWTEGRAVVVKNSEEITIENNTLRKNKIGIFAYKIDKIKILRNDIRETQIVGSLKCEYCENSEIAYNYLLDNGRPDWFWVPGNRIIGIWVAASNDVDIHDNTIIRSSSDGIGVSGTIDSSLEDPGKKDWTGVSKNIRIYNNLILDNLELGIWLARIDGMECFNNTIRDHFAPLMLDFDVVNSNFYNNKIVSWGGAPIGVGLGVARGNHLFNNTYYSVEQDEFLPPPGDSPGVNDIKFGWAGISPYLSSDNLFENNKIRMIGGELKKQLQSKLKRAEEEEIFKEKGWFACEIEEGLVDKECAEREKAKGNQGMPIELFTFEPLMENFDEFVVRNSGGRYDSRKEDIKKDLIEKKEARGIAYIAEQMMQSWKASLTILMIIIITTGIIYQKRKKKQKI